MVSPIPGSGSIKCPICDGDFLEDMPTANNLRSVIILLNMGVYLSTPKTEKLLEDGENDMLRYGLSSMQGWRSTMEDAHAACSNLDGSTSFFGVYDGHGGKDVAKFCAKFLHQQFLEHEAQGNDNLGTAVRKAFLRMDEMMCGKTGQKELALLRGKRSGGNAEGLTDSDEDNGTTDNWPSEGIHFDYQGPTSGCTACVAIIRNNILLVANAGDSRCVMSRKGQAQDLSKDHKPDLDGEKQRILEAGGYVQYGRVNGSLNLTRAIGDMEMKRNKSLPAEKQIVTANPDIVTVEHSEDDDFLIIACDGIWPVLLDFSTNCPLIHFESPKESITCINSNKEGRYPCCGRDCLSSQEAVDFVREQLNTESKLSVVCGKVLDKCLAPSSGGEGCDNMTMILIQFKKPSPNNEQQPDGPSVHSDTNPSHSSGASS